VTFAITVVKKYECVEHDARQGRQLLTIEEMMSEDSQLKARVKGTSASLA
jgi:hypothetical protein